VTFLRMIMGRLSGRSNMIASPARLTYRFL